MPLKMRGSVSARLSVRFSAVSAARKAGEIGGEDFKAAGIDAGHLRLAAQKMQRGSPLGAGLGEKQRAIRKIECGQIVLLAKLHAGGLQ